MPMPPDIIAMLHSGRAVAAELPASSPAFSAYIMVVPEVPNLHQHPEAWLNPDRIGTPPHVPLPALRDPAFISGYEIRHVAHDAKYTSTDWGWDYDIVLDAETTRIRRVFVSTEEEIESALSPWLTDMSLLRPCMEFDSSLVNSPIEGYLNRPEERSHLWQW